MISNHALCIWYPGSGPVPVLCVAVTGGAPHIPLILRNSPPFVFWPPRQKYLSVGKSQWLCFEIKNEQFHKRFWKSNPYEMDHRWETKTTDRFRLSCDTSRSGELRPIFAMPARLRRIYLRILINREHLDVFCNFSRKPVGRLRTCWRWAAPTPLCGWLNRHLRWRRRAQSRGPARSFGGSECDSVEKSECFYERRFRENSSLMSSFSMIVICHPLRYLAYEPFPYLGSRDSATHLTRSSTKWWVSAVHF